MLVLLLSKCTSSSVLRRAYASCGRRASNPLSHLPHAVYTSIIYFFFSYFINRSNRFRLWPFPTENEYFISGVRRVPTRKVLFIFFFLKGHPKKKLFRLDLCFLTWTRFLFLSRYFFFFICSLAVNRRTTIVIRLDSDITWSYMTCFEHSYVHISPVMNV